MKEIKKILFVIGSMQAGGAERVAARLCNHWAKNSNIKITLLTSDKIENDFYEVAEEVVRDSLRFEFSQVNFFQIIREQGSRFFKIKSKLRDINPDIIILSTTEISVRFLFNLIFSKKIIIVCEHNNYYALRSSFKRMCRRFLYKKASKILVLTNRDRMNYLEKKIINSKKISVMPNPLGIENEKLSKPNDNKVLIAVGRLCVQKSFDRLLRVMKHIREDYSLKIIGDGPEKENLERLILELDLSKRVQLIGKVKDISKYYTSSTLLLMTSKYEGLPMVISEANNFGLPVVSFNCPTGPAEMIESFKNGVLIDDGDIAGFAKTVNALLDDHDLLNNMRTLSFEMSKKYSIDKINLKWLETINFMNN